MAKIKNKKAIKFLRVQICTLLNLKNNEYFENNLRKIAIEILRFFNIIIYNESELNELIIELKQLYNET